MMKKVVDLCREILDNYTIDPDAVLSSGETAESRFKALVVEAIDKIEKEYP